MRTMMAIQGGTRSGWWLAVGLLVTALGPSPVRADDRSLTLEETLARTRRNNHDLAAARAVLVQAQSGVDKAFGALLPTAAAAGIYTHNYKNVTYANLFASKDLPPAQAAQLATLTSSLGNITVLKGDALQADLTVNVPLVAAPAWFALNAAKQSLVAADANGEVTETTVLFAAAQTFYAAAGADELLQARQDAVTVARATLENSQALLHAGKATRLDTDRAELVIVDAEQALREAQDVRDSTYRSLGTIMGVPDPVHVTPPAQAAAAPPETPVLVDESLRLRPEFGAYKANIKFSEQQAKADLWQWAPTLSAFGNVFGFNYAGITGDYYSYAFGLNLSWTVYDGGIRDAARREADAKRVENEEHLAQLRNTIADDITNASHALVTRHEGVTSAERAAAIANEALQLVRVQYAAGTATQLDVLTAQDALVSAEVKRAQARFDLALADLMLRRDAGTFPADVHAP